MGQDKELEALSALIREKGYTLTSLAEAMGTTKQNLNGKLKSPSYPTQKEIAAALDVPLWRLFASPGEVCPAPELTALIEYRGEFFSARSVSELRAVVNHIEKL